MILPNGTTVAVADGSTMMLFRNRGREPSIDLLGLPEPDVGDGNAGSGGRHRSTTANPDARRLAEDDFAAAASEYLNRAVLDGRIEKLLVIADARTLGEMRRHYHQSLADRLIGELAKDLVGRPKADIEAAIQAA